jgi:branched-chain amino acid aminotransferase
MLAGAAMANLCNIDGAIVPEAEARIPVLDRGFLFGDSVYEVMRTRAGGQLFAWQEHLARLHASAEGLGMPLDVDDGELLGRIAATIQAAALPECYVRVIVTRGTGTAPNIALGQAPGPQRWVLLVRALPPAGADARLWIVDRLRVDRRALDPALKSGNYLNNVLGLAEAQARGATDCVFLNGQGEVTEASTSNLFARHGRRVRTPPLDAGILAGVTRALLIGFLAASGDPVEQSPLNADDLRSADELFLTSTLRDLAPVTHIDGRPVGDGTAGPFARRLSPAFAAALDQRARERDGPELLRISRRRQ